MNLLELLPWRAPVRRRTDLAIVACPVWADVGWSEIVSSGRTAIIDASTTGMRIAGHTSYREGTALRMIVPGQSPRHETLEFQVTVTWARRNPLPMFGRFSYGVAFHPAAQPGVSELLARCRETETDGSVTLT